MLQKMKDGSDRKTIDWIGEVSGEGKICVAVLSVLQIVDGSTGVLYALFVRNIVDEAVAHNSRDFFRNAVFFVLVVLLQIVLFLVINRLNEFCKSVVENNFKERLFADILEKDFSYVSAVHSGEWLNRLTNDTKVVADGFTEILPGFIGMVVRFLAALVMILYIDWRIAAVMVPLGILLGITAYFLRKKQKKLHKGVQEADGRLRAFLQENMASLLLIRSFSIEKQALEDARFYLNEHKASRMKRIIFTSLTSMGFRLSLNAMFIFGVCYGGYGILMGTISYGTLMAITQLVNQLQTPIVGITGVIPRFYTTLASAERLMEIEMIQEEISDAEDEREEVLSVDDISKIYQDGFEEIELKNVGYTYYPPSINGQEFSKENMPIAIRDISLSVKKGKYVALVGHSGCGKSTILKLMMSIYRPDDGEVLVRINGAKQEIDKRWRNLFAYVPQGNYLMSGRIRDVVCLADRSKIKDERAITEALRIADAVDFVFELEDGLDTVLGERGTGLSEGQMQRLAIARAVLSERPILLLDEATSALDEQTERHVLENLRTMTDRTVVIVTHRSAALEICDEICRLESSAGGNC